MTEQDYITTADLIRIVNAKACLANVLPKTSLYITEAEYRVVMKTLAYWEQVHLENIKLKG